MGTPPTKMLADPWAVTGLYEPGSHSVQGYEGRSDPDAEHVRVSRRTVSHDVSHDGCVTATALISPISGQSSSASYA